MEQYLNTYYADNAGKLRGIVDRILSKFGGIADADKDDFYSLANEVFADVIKRYDRKQNFDGFLYSCLSNKIMTEISRRNCYKRKSDRMTVSIDTPLNEEEDLTIGDMIADRFRMEDALEELSDGWRDERVEEYMNSLPKIQRKIIEMKMREIPVSQIKKNLALTDREYGKAAAGLTSFDNIKQLRTLFAGSYSYEGKGEENNMTTTQTAEKSKPMQYSIASINKKIENRTIRFDHPLQRESDQWNPAMKGNLVSDILQGNPLPEIVFAEQIINGIPVIWDLDGKQRCTNCYAFANDGFKVSRNIRRWNIQYLTQIKDENGKPVLDESGFPISEYREFDIRNKKFSQLPVELQEKFLDYTFKCDQYLNCDSEEIAYHIIRYNEGKAMSKSQKGITRIGEEFATLVKSISAMPFFRERGGYKVSEAKNGTLERVVVESVMASKYLNDWNKQQEVICEYLKNNATTEDFDDFEDMITRLDAVITDDVAEMFDSKDSFLWFGLFARFRNTGEDDKKFIEFMEAFSRSLHKKAVHGTTYDELCIDKNTGNTRATKDKYIVIPKIELMETLMLDFLGISKEDTKDVDCVLFVREHVNPDATEEDVRYYKDNLDAWKVGISRNAKINDEKNIPSMIAISAYVSIHDETCDDETMIEWLIDYEKRNKRYILNQQENFLRMKADLEKFIKKRTAA